MQTINSEHNIEFTSCDDNGEFLIRIVKPHPGFSQMQIKVESRYDEAYVNVDRKELTAIRDMINTVLEETKKQE